MKNTINPGFIHLHVHSSYSLSKGSNKIQKLADMAKNDHQPALALTDIDNMFGALEFSEKVSAAGVQPIIGCDIAVDFEDQEDSTPWIIHQPSRIVLLAATEEGYMNLMKLNSRSYLESGAVQPHIKLHWLEGANEGIIALTGGVDGAIGTCLSLGFDRIADARCRSLADLFGDRLYVELQRHGLTNESAIEPRLIQIAYDLALPLVATNEPYFPDYSDYEANDALLCIADGRHVSDTNRNRLTAEHRFKTRAEMIDLFSDIPEALASTIEIASRCSYRPHTRKPILPHFSDDETQELRKQAQEGLQARLDKHGPCDGHTEKDYWERLEFELGVIGRMNYSGYFLIVSDFIKWAKQNGIPVGPGRGSGAGSLVAYSLTITDLDPLQFGLLFERFLNPDRVSMPDFDVDFCQSRRDEVIRYVQERYGREQVAQIITFGTFQSRGVMRDVGRVLQMPYGQVDRLCKMIAVNPTKPIKLAEAIELEPRLQEMRAEDSTVNRAFNISLKLEGLTRHASTHAAGIVIGDRPLDQLVPMYRDPKSDMPVTQFNMKWVEPAGLVKFDFLGLKTLTVIDVAVKLIRDRGVDFDLASIPINDPTTFEMLARGDVVGVFQIESAGMRRALIDMKADRIDDIIALVSLYRPGPMANIPTYCAVKCGQQEAEYPHPLLEPILKDTFGVIIYQEQVMKIAQVMAGYSLAQADLLRRAMGKKIREEMEKQRDVFVDGSIKNGVDREKAVEVFELLAKFADYGFNKSHAAAYAMISYQTAYLKAHFPVEFMAASMTLDMGDTDRLSQLYEDAKRTGIEVVNPSINKSFSEFSVSDGKIYYALSALKGVGKNAVDLIVETRKNGPFESLDDFVSRVDPDAINKRVIETLAAAGAFEEFEGNRARIYDGAGQLVAEIKNAKARNASNQIDMFGTIFAKDVIQLPKVESWPKAVKLRREYDAVGFFMSGHPLDDYVQEMDRLRLKTWDELGDAAKAGAEVGRTAATVISLLEKNTKTGKKIGIVTLSDRTGSYEAVLFSEGLEKNRELLQPGALVILKVGIELIGDDTKVRIVGAEPLERSAGSSRRGSVIRIDNAKVIDAIAPTLMSALAPERKLGAGVLLEMDAVGCSAVEIGLPGRFTVTPQLRDAISDVTGVQSIAA